MLRIGSPFPLRTLDMNSYFCSWSLPLKISSHMWPTWVGREFLSFDIRTTLTDWSRRARRSLLPLNYSMFRLMMVSEVASAFPSPSTTALSLALKVAASMVNCPPP